MYCPTVRPFTLAACTLLVTVEGRPSLPLLRMQVCCDALRCLLNDTRLEEDHLHEFMRSMAKAATVTALLALVEAVAL